MLKLIHYYLLFTIFFISVSSGIAANPARTFQFAIERQGVGEALIALSDQVDRQIFLRSSLVDGVNSRGVTGQYSLEAALHELLLGTGLKGEITSSGQIKISKDHGYFNSDFEPVAIERSLPRIEEMVVSGLQLAWQSSTSLKREATIIKDVLSESDMNKLPDGNIADSLQRFNGLQIERRNGDGTKFRIRGFDENVTLYNGELFLTGLEYFQLGLAEQGYENSIETVPVELLRRIEVYKSVRASDIEGAIGGTVDLISRNAFDVEDYLATADVKWDYGRFSKDPRPEFFVGLGKNWHDDFALLFTLNYSERRMHMDIAQNYVSRGVEENFISGTIGTWRDDDGSFDYLKSDYASFADIEQERTQSGASLNLAWRPRDNWKIQLDWFGIDSDLVQRNYELLFGIAQPVDSEVSFNTDYALPFLQSANYESIDQIFRTIGEKFTTRANNVNMQVSVDISDRIALDTRLSLAKSSFDVAVGNADLLSVFHARFLPYWIGDEPYLTPDGNEIFSPTGWTQLAAACPGCNVLDDVDAPLRYDVSAEDFVAYTDARQRLNVPEDTFGAFSQAKGARTEQEALSLRHDVRYQLDGGEDNNLSFGIRYSRRKSDFSQFRYLTNFSQTKNVALPTQFNEDGEVSEPTTFTPSQPSTSDNLGIALPVFNDLCGNGGLLAQQPCDINGDAFDDNLPFGAWVYQIDPTRQRDMLRFHGNNIYNNALYGQELGFFPPGFLPWRTYDQFPEDYVTLDDFYPSGQLSSHIGSFVNGEQIAANVEHWISGVAPSSPTQRFLIPRNSWRVSLHTAALYSEFNYRLETLPLRYNIGLRYVETRYDIQRSVLENGSGISLTPDNWYLSGVGSGWVLESLERNYRHWLPSTNVIWELSQNWHLRLAASRTISRPSFGDLGRGDNPVYQLDVGFGEFGPFAFNRAAEMTTGNPDLTPVEVTQGDISLEYFSEENSFFQLALFYKDINGQVFHGNTEASVLDETPEGSSEVVVMLPQNGDSSHAIGVELAAQRTWGLGFGASLNYSHNDIYSKASTLTMDNIGLPGVSKNVVNWTGFYESNRFSLQLSFNWRDEFISPYEGVSIVGFDSETEEFITLAQYYEDYSQWDLRAAYYPLDSLSVTLDVLNLTQSQQRSYLEFSQNRHSHTTWEPRVILGVQFNF